MRTGKHAVSVAVVAVLVPVALAACGPEGARIRGGGPGADVGNWPSDPDAVQLFNVDDSFERIYFETPRDLPPAAAGEPIMEPTAIPAQAAATAEGGAIPAASPESLPATPGATPEATPLAQATPAAAPAPDLATPDQTGGDGSTGSALPGTPTAVASPEGAPAASTPAANATPAATATP